MSIKSDLLQLIKDNLADVRISASKWYLSELIERENYPSGIEQYRIYKLTTTGLPDEVPTKSYVTNLAEFISELNEEDLVIEFMHGRYKPNDNKVAPISVTVGNLYVELVHSSEEDQKYIHLWGGSKTIKQVGFVLAYVCDNDPILPLKIVNVSLG